MGPQIRKLILNKEFDEILHGKKLDAWISFKKCLQNLLGLSSFKKFQRSYS